MLVPPIIALIAQLIGAPIDELPLTPAGCLVVSPNLDALVTCLDTFTVPHDYYSPLTYAVAQPLPAQRSAFSDAIHTLLSVDGDCAAKQVSSALLGLYAFAPFRGHCVLYETKSKCGTYAKGWGFAVVPARAAGVQRILHVSAPHPAYDLGTVEQAAAVYEGSGARSLLVAGRKRTAFLASSGCVKGAPRRAYYMTDPAHNNQEPFFDASVALHAWQHTQPGGCVPGACAFLQLHGKGAATCPNDDVFISAGLANSTAALPLYSSPIHPPARLAAALSTAFPGAHISTPASSRCSLTATQNVVGRAANGVPPSGVCAQAARVRDVDGTWLHAEQSGAMREREAYAAWVAVVKAAVDAVPVGAGGAREEREEGSEMEDVQALVDADHRVTLAAWSAWLLFAHYFALR